MKEQTKDKIIEAIIDVVKMAIYALGAVLFVNLLKDDVVKYINDYEKVQAIRKVAIQQRNERIDASVRLVRSARMLEYSRHVLDTRLTAGDEIFISDIQDFKDRIKEFSSGLKQYVSYSTDIQFGLLAVEINKILRDILDIINTAETQKKWQSLKRDLVLLGSQLSSLNSMLIKEH